MSGYTPYASVDASTTISPFQQTSVYSDKTRQLISQGRYHMLEDSGNLIANQLQKTVASIQDFFWLSFKLVGADDRGKIPDFLIDLGGKNAFYSPQLECFKFNNEYVQYPEVVCHEFTHAVMENLRATPLGNKGQLGAINEAIADVVGVIFKQTLSGQNNDWKVNGTQRDLSKQFRTTNVNPDFSPRYDSKTKEGNDNGHVHYNSQLLSHAFYLACKAYKKFDSSNNRKILSIWFNAARYLEINGEKDYFLEFARKTIELAQQEPDGGGFAPFIKSPWEQVGFFS